MRSQRVTVIRLFPLALAAILVLTAIPTGFRRPALELLYTRWSIGDILGNILLYFPLGLVSTHKFRRVLLLALGMSTVVELEQFLSISRYPGFLDIVANVGGASIGYLVAAALKEMGLNTAYAVFPRWMGWPALFAGITCVATLFPYGVSGDLSNWGRGCQIVFGDEATGGRRWFGEIGEAAILAYAAGPDLMEELARKGPGSIAGRPRPFREAPVFETSGRIDTRRTPKLETVEASNSILGPITQRNQVTVLLWLRSADRQQRGGRIIAYSCQAGYNNLLIGQQRGEFIFRLRTPAALSDGTALEVGTPKVLQADLDTLVAAVYDGRYAKMFVDGRLAGEADFQARRIFSPLPTLALALLGAALLSLGLLAICPINSRAVYALVSIPVVVLILNMPPKADPGLSIRLVIAVAAGLFATELCIIAQPRKIGPHDRD